MTKLPALALLLLGAAAPPSTRPIAGREGGRDAATSHPDVPGQDVEMTSLLDARESLALRSLVNRRLAAPEWGLRAMRDYSNAKINPQPNPTPDVRQHSTSPPVRPDDAETFDAWLPDLAAPNQLYGLIVFISPMEEPMGAPRGYRDTLARYGIAWIAPRSVGNDRALSWRIWSAMRAVQVFAAGHPLDPGRVYVSGMSGGGKSAMLAGLAFPETVTGTLSMCGPAYDAPVPAEGGGSYPAYHTVIDAAGLALRKTRPFFLYTGDADFNLAPTQRIADAMKQDGFQLVDTLVAKSQGHVMTRGDELGSILYEIDAPARDQLPALVKRGATQEKAGHPGPALLAYRQALSRDPDHAVGATEAQALRDKYDIDMTAATTPEKLRQLKVRWGDVRWASPSDGAPPPTGP